MSDEFYAGVGRAIDRDEAASVPDAATVAKDGWFALLTLLQQKGLITPGEGAWVVRMGLLSTPPDPRAARECWFGKETGEPEDPPAVTQN